MTHLRRRPTPAERAKAIQQRRVVSRLERAVVKHARAGVNSVDELRALVSLLRDVGVASHLIGCDAVLKIRPVCAANLFEEAINALKARGDVPLNDLRDVYGDKAQDAIAKLERDAEERIAEILEEEAQEGALQRAGVSAIKNAFESLGIAPRNSYSLENIFRTQMLLGYGGGRWAAAQDPAVQEILEAYRYVTAGDDRVREEHEALDGMTAAVDYPVWLTCWPPNGYSCRCQVLMVFDFDQERDEWVPDEETIRAAITPGFGYNVGELFKQ